MKTDVTRIAHYNARMQSSLIDPTLTAVNSLAQTNYASYLGIFYPKQVAVSAILDTNAVPNYQRGWYQACAGQMYHQSRVATGDALVFEFTALADKWESRGCDRAILISIASSVYSVTIT